MTLDVGEAAVLAAEIKHALKQRGLRPQVKTLIKFETLDGYVVELTFEPAAIAQNTGFESPPR